MAGSKKEEGEEDMELPKVMASIHIADRFKATNDRILHSLEQYTGFNQNYTNNLSFAMVFNDHGSSIHGLYGIIALSPQETRMLCEAIDEMLKHKEGVLLKPGGWWTNGPTLWNKDLRTREAYKITASLFPRDFVHPRVEMLGTAFCVQVASKFPGISGYFSDNYYAGMECCTVPDLHAFLGKCLPLPGRQEG